MKNIIKVLTKIIAAVEPSPRLVAALNHVIAEVDEEFCYRGYLDILPSKIKPLFIRQDAKFVFGKGDYYSLDKNTAEYYGYKHADAFGVVIKYPMPKGNIVTLEDDVDFTHKEDIQYGGKLTLTTKGQKKLKIKNPKLKGEQLSGIVVSAGYDGFIVIEKGENPAFKPLLILVKGKGLTPISYDIYVTGWDDKKDEELPPVPKKVQKLGKFIQYPESGFGDTITDITPSNITKIEPYLKKLTS